MNDIISYFDLLLLFNVIIIKERLYSKWLLLWCNNMYCNNWCCVINLRSKRWMFIM